MTTEEDVDKARELLATLVPSTVTDGEVRVVNKCRTCGKLWAHQYIPYGIGRGIMWKPCLCHCTGNDQKGHSVIVSVDPRTQDRDALFTNTRTVGR